MECWCRVVTVVEYIKNTTSSHSPYQDIDYTIAHMVSLVEGNMNLFEDIYSTVQSVKSGGCGQTHTRMGVRTEFITYIMSLHLFFVLLS